MRAIRSTSISILALGLLAGSGVGVAADHGQRAYPEEFNSKAVWASQASPGRAERHGDGSRTLTGEAWEFRVTETSDPRLDGTMTLSVADEVYPLEEVEVHITAFRIVNDGGEWQEVPRFELGFPWTPEPANDGVGVVKQRIFHGEGGYEGLTVVADETWTGGGFELRGFIVDGLPSPPEPS